MFNRPPIAIDIGSSCIKIVELTGVKQKTLRAVGLETLPKGAVQDGMIVDQQIVEETLKALLKKLKINTRGRRASISLGGSSVIVKKINIAAGKETEVAEQVFYEAEQHFQAEMSDIFFDYQELAVSNQETGELPVLLCGAKREMVEQHLSAVRASGMRCGVVECDVFSVSNMFEYNYGVVPGLTALVNVGASTTQVSVVNGGEYLYTRDVPIGGDEFSARISESLGVDLENAETLKVAASIGEGAAPEEVHTVIGELNDQLVSEIQMTLDYFAQSGEVSVEESRMTSLFLTGGASRVLGLDAALAAAVQVPVQILNPFQNIEVNPKKFKMDYVLMQGHLYGVAVGLGMRSMGDNE
jgi:type IV pilus assembly protein PilM